MVSETKRLINGGLQKNSSPVHTILIDHYINHYVVTEALCNVMVCVHHKTFTVKPLYNDHLYNIIYYLWFIQ